jgi:hypothetical protein
VCLVIDAIRAKNQKSITAPVICSNAIHSMSYKRDEMRSAKSQEEGGILGARANF